MSLRPDLTILKSVTKTSPGGAVAFKIDFGAALNVSVANGTYTVVCFLPENTHLVSVLWAEP